jgi:hypothetical protein
MLPPILIRYALNSFSLDISKQFCCSYQCKNTRFGCLAHFLIFAPFGLPPKINFWGPHQLTTNWPNMLHRYIPSLSSIPGTKSPIFSMCECCYSLIALKWPTSQRDIVATELLYHLRYPTVILFFCFPTWISMFLPSWSDYYYYFEKRVESDAR